MIGHKSPFLVDAHTPSFTAIAVFLIEQFFLQVSPRLIPRETNAALSRLPLPSSLSGTIFS
jgi:hypothetical protein